MYTVRLKLELSKSEERFMSKCFFFMNTIHNRIVSHAQNRINALFHDSDYMSVWICKEEVCSAVFCTEETQEAAFSTDERQTD